MTLGVAGHGRLWIPGLDTVLEPSRTLAMTVAPC